MSVNPRKTGISLHLPGVRDAARRRGRGEAHAVAWSMMRVAGRLLVLGLISLGALLPPMGGRAINHHADGDRQDGPAAPSRNNPPSLPSLNPEPHHVQRGSSNPSSFTMPGRWASGPDISIDVYQSNLPGLFPALLASRDRTWPEKLDPSQPGRTSMSQSMMFDELEEASPMFEAFRGQLDALGPHGRSYDLTALWKAAGRPRGHAPRHYLHRFRESMRGEVRDQGGGPDGAVLSDYPTALHYCMIVDRRIMDAVVDESIRRRRKDPVRALLECPNPIMAMLVKTDLYLRGLSDEQADRLLIEAAKRAAAGLDVYEEEVRVAEVQRAVASFGPVEAGPPPGSGRPNSR